MQLSAEEVRVLGCLIEKSATTPDSYPLSTNALANACNQKSSRDPVVSYSDRDATAAMLLLRPAGLARTVSGAGRVEKHRHTADEALGLDEEQLAVIAVLALRGPQSPGELRTRTERYVSFHDVEQVESVLRRLAERSEPLVVDLGRGSGQTQNRWTHLLTGEPTLAEERASVPGFSSSQTVARSAGSSSSPSLVLEARVSALEARLARLEAALGVDDGETDAETI
jgi:uncharacterized protein YceH (UPF0502 family)